MCMCSKKICFKATREARSACQLYINILLSPSYISITPEKNTIFVPLLVCEPNNIPTPAQAQVSNTIPREIWNCLPRIVTLFTLGRQDWGYQSELQYVDSTKKQLEGELQIGQLLECLHCRCWQCRVPRKIREVVYIRRRRGRLMNRDAGLDMWDHLLQ